MMTTKLYVELEPLLELLERYCSVSEIHNVRRLAVPLYMPPPDPPDHGPHLGANGLLAWLDERIEHYQEENAVHHLHEAREIRRGIRAAIAAQKEQGR